MLLKLEKQHSKRHLMLLPQRQQLHLMLLLLRQQLYLMLLQFRQKVYFVPVLGAELAALLQHRRFVTLPATSHRYCLCLTNLAQHQTDMVRVCSFRGVLSRLKYGR